MTVSCNSLSHFVHVVLGKSKELASCTNMQVTGWYMLSEPVAPPAAVATRTQGTAAAAATAAAPADSSAEGETGAAAQRAQQERITYAQLVEDMIPMAGGRDGPPPALSRNGEFSGWVYTMASEKYDRSEVMKKLRLHLMWHVSRTSTHSEADLKCAYTGTCRLAP